MKKRLFLILTGVFTSIVLLASGCGQTKVEGKVTYSDGTPLSAGTIVFENSTNTYTAKIHEDGTFRLGVLKDGSGIPTGKYNVAIANAIDHNEINNEQTPESKTGKKDKATIEREKAKEKAREKTKAQLTGKTKPTKKGTGTLRERPPIPDHVLNRIGAKSTGTPLVAEKYRSTKTSGIEYDIQKNTRDIVIVVEKP
ncbi:MAG: hypothetical protein LBB88_01500 [Planctomycetaceae bacterium]|jgi:hypothetical protein|nr:hypothetical protein [Planctomycetaceae bacterium]